MTTLPIKKMLLSFALVFTIVGFAAVVAAEEPAPTPCSRTEFKTKLIKKACKSGQKAAQKTMKTFVKSIKKAKKADGEKVRINCLTCHAKLKPGFPLKKNALADFKKYKKYLKSKAKK